MAENGLVGRDRQPDKLGVDLLVLMNREDDGHAIVSLAAIISMTPLELSHLLSDWHSPIIPSLMQSFVVCIEMMAVGCREPYCWAPFLFASPEWGYNKVEIS